MFRKILFTLLTIFLFVSTQASFADNEVLQKTHPVERLVGERLAYDVSFLWFKNLAEGTISLERGDKPGTYLAVMEARTRGFAAFVTKHRIEKYQTLMEIGPNGLLRPLVHSSHTFKGQGDQQKEKRTSYSFNYDNRQVHYQKMKYQQIAVDENLPLETEGPVYDILSAFYNLRLEAFGALDGDEIHLPTFHRKGIEEIVVAPLKNEKHADNRFFANQGTLCKVLVDPSVFKTDGSELFVSFDRQNRLERGIIKNVIGLGDVKGVLRQVTQVAQVTE
ncbi:DUF3108 domain-containing protein [Malonomonas rubra]|uniref:DUF3108 domain-containing protein n=1 Tax=Malonomonas rubra TaxID=57040 RepID=UPI0026EB13C2|nr:DUF3108 domain-containing protein [Malonomonas rubra]